MEEPPFAYGDIKFCRLQMMWLIEHLEVLGEGQWPDSVRGLDLPWVGKALNEKGYFVGAAEMAGFVDWRLKLTGVDGKLLKDEIQLGKQLDDLQPEARRALDYISGFKRKKLSYTEWVRHKKRELVSDARYF